MGTYPTTPRADFLAWCAQHGPIFTANAAAIGLTPAQASAFNTLVTAAQTKLGNQEDARSAFRNATLEIDDAVAALKVGAADTVRLIRAFAEVQTKPLTVYTTADIPPPSSPSPMPPPGQCTNLTVTLTPGLGRLTLAWKCENPVGASGTSYIVRRQLPGEAAPQYIGTTGKKKFVDATFISGPDVVFYTVQAQRSDSPGPESEPFLVRFGSAPGGGMTVSVSQMSRTESESGAAAGLTGSTVNGRSVSKTLPTGNGHASRV